MLQECHGRHRFADISASQLPREAEARLEIFELGWSSQTPAYGQFYTALHIPDSSPAQMRSYNDLLRRTTSPANAVQLLRTFWTVDVRDVIPKVACPALVLHARGNAVIPFDEGRKVAALIPGARFVPLESGNHILLDTEPAWGSFVEAVDQFLPFPPSATPASWAGDLTAREREVLGVLALGADNAEIAARLGISAEDGSKSPFHYIWQAWRAKPHSGRRARPRSWFRSQIALESGCSGRICLFCLGSEERMPAGSSGRGKCPYTLTELLRSQKTLIWCHPRDRARHEAWSAWKRCYIRRAQALSAPGKNDPLLTNRHHRDFVA